MLLTGLTAVGPQAAQAAGTALPQVVSAVPASGTPDVNDGTVFAFGEVGSTMVVGGSFTTVEGQPRRGVFAFSTATNAVRTSFSPVLDGDVKALWPGPVADTVYVAGTFNNVNGVKNKGLVLLSLATGARVSSFKTIPFNGVVNAVKLVGSRLYIGGTFTTVDGQPRGGLAALNPTTGVLDPFVLNNVATNHNWTPTSSPSVAKAAVGVTDLDVTPDGTKMVVIGNFKTVDGLSRDQVVVLDLSGATSVVQPNWRTAGYEPACYLNAYDSYVRDVDISPDGTWFAIATTGGGNTTLCDTVARFSFAATGETILPTWKSVSGGDSLLSVVVAGSVVYTGGHQRWMNNNNGNDRAGTGAVPRPGLSALDSRTGQPIKWNPGRNPRGSGAWAAYVTGSGLWIGSDTDWIGDHDYRRYKMAFFPLAGGSPLAADAPKPLPGGIYTGTSGRADFTGDTATAPTALPIPLSTTTTRGSVLIGNQLFYGRSDTNLFYVRTFDGTTFGPETLVDPYLDPKWFAVDTGSGQNFAGSRPSFYTELASITSAFYADGFLYYTLANSSGLFFRAFSPDSGIVAPNRSQVPGVSLPAVSGAFLAEGNLYYVNAGNGTLSRAPFSGGTVTGPATVLTGAGVTGVDWRSRVFFFGPPTPPNQLPDAAATASCDSLTCTFKGSSSTDPDGTLVSYAWDFGDGSTASAANPSHEYATAGTFTATLTVTDNRGGQDTASVQVAPAPQPATPIGFRAGTSVNRVTAAAAVTVPSAVEAGDQMLLIATSGTATGHTTPDGWSQVARQASSGVLTTVWQRTATATDASSVVTVPLSASTKVALQLAAYSAAGPVSAAVTAAAATGTTHTAPSSSVATVGSWVLRYWADKSSTTTGWSTPGDVTVRDTSLGTGAGFITAVVADSNAAIATGPTGTSVATTDASSSRDVTATLVLPPKQ